MFDAVIELEGGEGGEQPRWTIVRNVDDVVDELLADGAVSRSEMRMPLDEDMVRKRKIALRHKSRGAYVCWVGQCLVLKCVLVPNCLPSFIQP